MKIDFLYLNEEDMIKAGVMDPAGCIKTMEDTMSLFGKKDFLLGGPKGDEHGLQMNFPQKSDIEDFPLDDGPDRRFMAMPAYLGGRFHIAGQKFYGSNSPPAIIQPLSCRDLFLWSHFPMWIREHLRRSCQLIF